MSKQDKVRVQCGVCYKWQEGSTHECSGGQYVRRSSRGTYVGVLRRGLVDARAYPVNEVNPAPAREPVACSECAQLRADLDRAEAALKRHLGSRGALEWAADGIALAWRVVRRVRG